jgi:Flp pilus assembly protein TadD
MTAAIRPTHDRFDLARVHMNFSLSRELLRSASKLAIAAATAGVLAGCSSSNSFSSAGEGSSSTSTFATIEPDGQDFVGGAAYWGAKYEADRENIAAGMGFARNLRMMGGARQAISVLKEIVMKAPDDSRVLSEYGKALTAAGRVQDALPFLARSTQINGDDWTTFSAYGVALDQTGNHTSARTNYQMALGISPGNPTVESNMAMSHVLEGEIDKAELILRRLVSRPDATPQMRQNLAMVSAIKGNSACSSSTPETSRSTSSR